jgi:hypothetical protein
MNVVINGQTILRDLDQKLFFPKRCRFQRAVDSGSGLDPSQQRLWSEWHQILCYFQQNIEDK